MTKILSVNIERNAKAAPCDCGGYADEVDDITQEEISNQTCGKHKSYACCIAAFVCRSCKQRFLVHLPAPEMV